MSPGQLLHTHTQLKLKVWIACSQWVSEWPIARVINLSINQPNCPFTWCLHASLLPLVYGRAAIGWSVSVIHWLERAMDARTLRSQGPPRPRLSNGGTRSVTDREWSCHSAAGARSAAADHHDWSGGASGGRCMRNLGDEFVGLKR